MSTRLSPAVLALIAGAAATLAGCDSVRSMFGGGASNTTRQSADAVANPQSQTGDPTPTRGEREVEFPATTQAFTGGDASQFADASVPVLAPAAMSTEQAETFSDSYRTTPDGYFAQMPTDQFDVVVNGTRNFTVAPESAGAQTRDTSDIQFSESDTGLSATFNRFGADYSIDFVCRGGGDVGGACVDEAEAAEFVNRLVPVGGGGR